MKSLHLFISGFVQGVGFRQFVKKEAQKFGIVGCVTNLSDGRVEVMVQAIDNQNLQQFIETCSKGPFLSEVKDVVIEEKETEEKFTDFQIIH